MSNNTYQHISNESVYVKFDPVGTKFPPNVVNVQQALAAIESNALSPLPYASETNAGISEIATQDEVNEGIIDNKFVSPATLKVRLAHPEATEAQYGITRYATTDETLKATSNETSITPLHLKEYIDNAFTTRKSTEDKLGVIKISTESAALAMTDDTTAMTPKKTQKAIAKMIAQIPEVPAPSPATESIQGIVRLATVSQAQQGTLKEGYAISPYTFANTTATESSKGVVRFGTQVEINNNSNNLAVSGATLNGRIATTSTRGVVRLTTQAGTKSGDDASSVLAWNADVIHQRGGQTINGTLKLNNALTVGAGGINVSGNSKITGTLNVSGDTTISGTVRMNGGYVGSNRIITQNEVDGILPVGSIVMWSSDHLPNNNWRFCHGGTVSSSECPLYASRIGTKYGGNSSNPGLPDMRGLFVRGSGRGGHLTNPNVNGNDKFGKPRLAVGCTGGYVGEVQKQQMSFHKHAGGFGEHDDAGAFGNTVRSNFVGTRKGLDWDNRSYFTNEGYEIDPENRRTSKSTLNRPEIIGNETRPWNISLNYIIKVK